MSPVVWDAHQILVRVFIYIHHDIITHKCKQRVYVKIYRNIYIVSLALQF